MRERWCLARNGGARKRAGRAVAPLLAVLTAGSPAAARDAAAPPCSPDGGEAARVAAVTDDLALRLADGRTIVIAGVDPARATAAHPALGSDARARVAAWLDGRDVVVRTLASASDRWDRWPALVFAGTRADDPPTLSVALALVDAGLARARPDPAARACRTALLGAEGGARAAGLGLWADPYYAVREASDAGAWSGGSGALALVEGRVTRVRGGGSWTTIDLDGPEADFSVRLGKREMAALALRGLARDGLKGARLRVRGLLDDRFGVGLDGVEADGIEVLDAAGASADAVAR